MPTLKHCVEHRIYTDSCSGCYMLQYGSPNKASSLPSRQDLLNRIKDEAHGVGQRASLNTGAPKGTSEVLPDMDDLELSTITKRTLTMKVSAFSEEAADLVKMIGETAFGHVELGLLERKAKKKRDVLGHDIKDILASDVGDETKTFYCHSTKITRFTQNRSSFSQEMAKQELLKLGVDPVKITKAWAKATTVKPIETLKITPPGGDDDGS